MDSDRRYGTGDVFNWKASNTRRLQRSLAKAMNGSGFADHLIIGDSESALYVGSVNYPAMWPYVLRTLMNARGMPLGGTGWVPNGSGGTLAPDPRWALTGTWTDAGYQRSFTVASTLTFTSDLPGTSLVLAYDQSSAHFDISVDGGATVNIFPSGASQTVGFYVATGLANTTHTIKVTVVTGATNTIIFGAQTYGSSGLRIHNVAQAGLAAFDWSTAVYPIRSWVVNNLGLTPDVVHIALGVNDFNHWSSVASDVVGYLTTIRNAWPFADVILYGQYEPTPITGVTAPWSDTWAKYIQALYSLALTLDCPLVNLYQRSGSSYTAANANGLMGDTIHPNAIAQADWGLLVTNLYTRAV